MGIRVKDIIKLESFKKMKLIGGKVGLDKNVDWVYVAECFENPFESVKWLYGGEIVFITGRGIKEDEDLLENLIKGFGEKNIAGLIINIGPYIKHIPKKIIDLSDELKLPLFELPWEVRITEASQEIYTAIAMSRVQENSISNFFNDLLFRKENIEGNPVEKASYFGYNLSGKCRVYIVDIDRFSEYIKLNNIKDESEISQVKIKLMKIIQDTLERNNIRAPILYKNDSVIFLYRFQENRINDLDRALNQIKNNVLEEIKDISVSIGIGDYYNDLNKMKQSLKEAELALKKIKITKLKNSILEYKNMGVYQLLFSIEDNESLKNYCKNTLNPIIKYDNINNSQLVETLELYLDENCNITTTSEKLFLHRNTLRYRVKKIEELLDLDLHDFNQCIKLKIALEVKKIIGEN